MGCGKASVPCVCAAPYELHALARALATPGRPLWKQFPPVRGRRGRAATLWRAPKGVARGATGRGRTGRDRAAPHLPPPTPCRPALHPAPRHPALPWPAPTGAPASTALPCNALDLHLDPDHPDPTPGHDCQQRPPHLTACCAPWHCPASPPPAPAPPRPHGTAPRPGRPLSRRPAAGIPVARGVFGFRACADGRSAWARPAWGAPGTVCCRRRCCSPFRAAPSPRPGPAA